MKTALLVIDIQKDYFPGGKYPLVEPLAAAKKAADEAKKSTEEPKKAP